MENQGEIIIHLEGKYGAEPLTPVNYDILLMRDVLAYASDLLNLEKNKNRPAVTFHTESGSVKNVFTVTKQKAVEFASVISLIIANNNSLDALEPKTAMAFENIHKLAVQNDFKIDIHSSQDEQTILRITPETSFKRSENIWVDAEIYYYGVLTNAGGKNKSNIHIETEAGTLKIDADKDLLSSIQGNPLYKKFGVVTLAKQNVLTGEIDTSSLKLKNLFEFEPKFDMNYLSEKIEASTPIWKNEDVDSFLDYIREGDL